MKSLLLDHHVLEKIKMYRAEIKLQLNREPEEWINIAYESSDKELAIKNLLKTIK